MQDIHDITPPVQVGIDPAVIKYALLGFGLALLFAVILFIVRYFLKKRKQKNRNILLLPSPLPPDVAALKELGSLRDLMGKYPRLFCFKISGVFKTYLGKQFKINAPEMTTEELVAHLRNLDLEKESAAGAKKFLLSLDHIKYAGAVPTMEKMEKDYNFVKDFIQSVCRENPEKTSEKVAKAQPAENPGKI